VIYISKYVLLLFYEQPFLGIFDSLSHLSGFFGIFDSFFLGFFGIFDSLLSSITPSSINISIGVSTTLHFSESQKYTSPVLLL